VKSAWGGTTLATDWSPEKPTNKRLFEQTVKLTKDAIADLSKKGKKPRIAAFLWHQGENDMLSDELVKGYGERLQHFIAAMRSALDAPKLPFLIGEISDKGIWGLDHRRNMQELRKQQQGACDADPLVHFVETSHLAFDVMDGGQPHYHFGTEGELQHGVAYAQTWLRLAGTPIELRPKIYTRLPSAVRGEVRVFIVAGQRTAEGDGCYVANLPTRGKDAALSKPLQSVPFRYRLGGGAHTSQDWTPLGPAGFFGTFGPELSLGHALDDALKDPIAIIKITHSAAMLRDWLPDGDERSRPQLDGATAFVLEAIADLESRGLKPRLAALFWITGEHDVYWKPYSDNYASDLAKFIPALRERLKTPDLQVFLSEPADRMRWGKEKLDAMDAQLTTAAASILRVSVVPSSSVETDESCVTFGTVGTVALGRLLAKHYLDGLRK
jgi:hypothetical protein